jgi:carboxypeptidase C (cathepsin A)
MKAPSLNGWFDLATPFLTTEYDLDHMMREPPARANLSIDDYPSGHRVYLNPEALKQPRADLGRFHDLAAPQ